MSSPGRTVLITGCSDGGLGSGLALAFNARGLRVLATARNPSKMSSLSSIGVETLTLDVLDNESIKSCVQQVSSLTDGRLDILINNAGGGYNMPVLDLDISEAKKLFDLNVWSYLSVTQAFSPLLLAAAKSNPSDGPGAIIVNNTSISSVSLTPFNAAYHASKCAAAMFSSHMRLEFSPFNIAVVDLKTGSVKTNFHSNRSDPSTLPSGSLYQPIKAEAEINMNGVLFLPTSMALEEWSGAVVEDLIRKRGPPAEVWRGRRAAKTWWEWVLYPTVTWGDGALLKESGLEKLKGLVMGS